MAFVSGMANEENTDPGETDPGSDNLRERLSALVEKTARLNESLDRVKKNLKEASGNASSSGQRD